MGRRIGIGIVACLATLLFAAAAQADVVVQNGNDSGVGSLREAIEFVEPGGTVVVPASVGEIHLNSEIAISHTVTIEGTGATRPEISADGKSRVFKIGNPVDVEISGVTITEGKGELQGTVSYGGGILVEEGDVTLRNVFMDRNEVDTSGGGANGFAVGGAIATGLTASLTLKDSILSDNRAVGGSGAMAEAFGGAIAAGGELLIEGGEIKGNYAEASKVSGGGLYIDSEKTAMLKGVLVTGNEVKPYPGSTSQQAWGGGIDLDGPATLEGVDVVRNKASADAATGKLGNAAGGGLQSEAPATIVNSTFTANLVTAQVEENGAAAGGAIFSGTKPVSIVNSTLAGNSAQASGTGSFARGGDLWASAPTTLTDTILAAGETSNGPQNCFASPLGSVVSGGHNIDSAQSCALLGAGDLSNTDPKLGPLAANGGPVETMALLAGSPAIDAGGTECPPTDARGVLRPGGAACDIGAFEVATPAAVTEAATGVGLDRATLTGTATDPDFKGGTVSFQYGTATGYESQTPAQAIGATTRARFTAPIAGLTANTTYHFRIVVTNALGTTVGADQTFTTPSPTKVVIKVAPPPARPTITLKRLKGLAFRVHCAGGPCTGNLVATARSGKRRLVVAKAKLRLADGATRKVTLAPTKRGKALIAVPGKLPVVVRTKLAGGASAPKPLRFKLG